jgi:hypothetical protein
MLTEEATRDQSDKGTEIFDGSMIWQIWVSENLNTEADILVRWSRTSFFGGCPISQPKTFAGKEYALFYRGNDEWAMRYVLELAISNYGLIKLTRSNLEVPIEPYLSKSSGPSRSLLGDAASMGRSGGMC